MFKRIVDIVQWIVAALTVVTVVVLFTAEPTVATEVAPDLTAGAEVFSSNCAACHGASGEGGIGPAVIGEGTLTRFETADEVLTFVSVGSPGSMPGFETRLTPDDLNDVAQFLFES